MYPVDSAHVNTHVQYCRADTDRYLQLTVRMFRTDHHSCLRSVICGPYASHGPSFLLTDRYLQLTVHTFRTDRHSYLQSEYRACISLSRQGQLLTVRTFRMDRHSCLRTVIYG